MKVAVVVFPNNMMAFLNMNIEDFPLDSCQGMLILLVPSRTNGFFGCYDLPCP